MSATQPLGPLMHSFFADHKWRTCPLWHQTAELLGSRLESFGPPPTPQSAVFTAHGQALTRFGIYKIVRRHAAGLDDARTDRRVSPHTFRHTAAVHLVEAGVEVDVIRGWLGHAELTTTNRYAEINTRAKVEALRAEPPGSSAGPRTRPVRQSDEIAAQLARLALSVMWPGSDTRSRAPARSQPRRRRRAHNRAGHISATTCAGG